MLSKKWIYTTSLVAVAGLSLAFFLTDRSEISGLYCKKLANESIYTGGLEQYRTLIAGHNGWVFRTENDFRSDFTINPKTKNYLLTLQKALKEKGIDLVIVYPPVRGLIHVDQLPRKHKKAFGLTQPEKVWENYETSIRDMQKAGLNIVGISRSEVTPDFYYKRNHHWTAAGARLTAQKTASFVKNLPEYKSVSKAVYTTTEGAPAQYESSFQKPFHKVCDAELPPEMALQYTTTKAIENNAAQNLFGVTAEPQIVLLGTSNSVQDSSSANFEGFLKEALSADISNKAYIGAGIDTSIISFLNSDSYRSGNIRVAIWEVPGYYDFNIMDDKLFQQIIPAVYGSCTENPILTRTINNLPAGRNVLFDSNPDKASLQPASTSLAESMPASQEGISALKKTNGNYYIKFIFSEPVEEKFSLKFQYEGNGTKKQEFDRSERYPHDNAFYTLFPANADNEDLANISLDIPASMKGLNVQAEICSLPQS